MMIVSPLLHSLANITLRHVDLCYISACYYIKKKTLLP